MKQKYTLEFPFKCSAKVLFNRLSTPDGLSEWFADDVNVKDNTYAFNWEGSEEEAERITLKDNKSIRFHWIEDDEKDTFFEFKIIADELSNELALIITDFADENEIEDAKELWEQQISQLKHLLGI